MASGFVNQFNPPKYSNPKRKIPPTLLDFEKNKSQTKNNVRGKEANQSTAIFDLNKAKNNSGIASNAKEIPSALLNFEKNRAKTKSRVSENNEEENFSQFENAMSRKDVSDTYDGKITNSANIVISLISTEDSNFTLNTEDNNQIITAQ